MPTQHLNLRQQVRSSAWLIGFYAVTLVLSKLGSFGGLGVLSHPFDTLVVAACALGIYCWGAATGVPAHLVRLGADDESEADAAVGEHPVGAGIQASS
ncbi:Aspartate-proton symporter [compost metagenome]